MVPPGGVIVGTKFDTRHATKLLASAVERGGLSGCAEVAWGALWAADDRAVVVVVAEVEYGARLKGFAASPAVNESSVNEWFPLFAVALELFAVASLLLAASLLVVFAVVFGAVASVCCLDAVGLGAIALHGHVYLHSNRQHMQDWGDSGAC